MVNLKSCEQAENQRHLGIKPREFGSLEWLMLQRNSKNDTACTTLSELHFLNCGRLHGTRWTILLDYDHMHNKAFENHAVKRPTVQALTCVLTHLPVFVVVQGVFFVARRPPISKQCSEKNRRKIIIIKLVLTH